MVIAGLVAKGAKFNFFGSARGSARRTCSSAELPNRAEPLGSAELPNLTELSVAHYEFKLFVTLLFFDIFAEIKTFLKAGFCRLSNYGSRFGRLH